MWLAPHRGFRGFFAATAYETNTLHWLSRSVCMQRILIVDDSATIRKMVRTSLHELEGAEFIEAGTGLEAIEHLALGPISLMVLDLNMPDMHGIDVMKFVRGHKPYKDVPIIVLTTRGDESSRQTAVEAGATTYLTKPFVPQVLSNTARALIDHSGDRVTQG
jgi:two-component system, chemotaxis family, chemotaxis protein CheY